MTLYFVKLAFNNLKNKKIDFKNSNIYIKYIKDKLNQIQDQFSLFDF